MRTEIYDANGLVEVIDNRTPEEIAENQKQVMRAAIQAHIDTTAQSRNYDSGNSLATYINCGVAEWEAEAQAFVSWRSAVWLHVFNMLAQVKDGTAEPPASAEELIGALPQIEW